MRTLTYIAAAGLMALAAVPQRSAKATMREEIENSYRLWEAARLSYDEKAFDEMLAPNFYVLLNGKRESREAFIGMIMSKSAKLVRFDSAIQTLTAADDSWVAVITEKIEWDTVDASGKPAKVYALWVTKDGWRKVGDKWQILYSEAIGNEGWRERPPFKDW